MNFCAGQVQAYRACIPCADMYVGMCTGMCIDMCIHMCMDMCMGMCMEMDVGHVRDLILSRMAEAYPTLRMRTQWE